MARKSGNAGASFFVVNSPGKLRMLGFFWAMELVASVLFFAGGVYISGQDAVFGMVIAAMSAFLFPTSLAFLSDIRFRLADAHPTIEVSQAGFLDRRLTREPIPWDEIAGIPYYWYRQRSLAVILKDPGNARLAPIFALKFQEWLGRMLNMPGYPVIISGTDTDVPSLEAAIRRFAPHVVRAP